MNQHFNRKSAGKLRRKWLSESYLHLLALKCLYMYTSDEYAYFLLVHHHFLCLSASSVSHTSCVSQLPLSPSFPCHTTSDWKAMGSSHVHPSFTPASSSAVTCHIRQLRGIHSLCPLATTPPLFLVSSKSFTMMP